MAKKTPESKASKVEKITKSNNNKKKWTSGRVVEAVKRLEKIDQDIFNKIQKDAMNCRTITRTAVSERYNLSLNLSIKVLKFLEENNIVKLIFSNRGAKIYAGNKYEPLVETKAEAPVAAEEEWA